MLTNTCCTTSTGTSTTYTATPSYWTTTDSIINPTYLDYVKENE